MKILDIILESKEREVNGFKVMSLDDFLKSENGSDSDVDEAFGLGARYRKADDSEMQDYLGRVKTKSKTKRDKFDYPYVHGSSIEIKNQSGQDYDLDKLRAEVSARPKSILGQNAKMQHSETGSQAVYDIGLSELQGLAVNEETGEFVVLDN